MRAAPSPDECRRLLAELGVPPPVVAHCEAVARAAQAVAAAIAQRGTVVDQDLVAAGAMLHDIGRARTHTIAHASLGAALLRERGLPEPLCRVVERHTGGGIDASEARRLGLPAKDYTPTTLEEKIVCQADNLVDGARRQKVQEELDDLARRGLEPVARKISALHRELSRLAGRDLDEVA